MSIAVGIHRASRGVLTDPGGRLETVRVAVGELTAVDPDLLGYAWEALVEGGPDADARLEVEWCPTRQFCVTCGEDKPRANGSWLPACPDCDMPLQVEGGRELDVLQVCWRTEDV
jgi:hydrogenase nickel incorporation protein HypA/HybF